VHCIRIVGSLEPGRARRVFGAHIVRDSSHEAVIPASPCVPRSASLTLTCPLTWMPSIPDLQCSTRQHGHHRDSPPDDGDRPENVPL
jgi:hypothetical protein